MPLESVDDVKGGDGLALGVLSVSDCVTNDTLEEGLEDTASLFVDHWRATVLVTGSGVLDELRVVMLTGRDTLDTATTRQTTDSWLGDTLDVVAQDLPVALGTTLSETLATFSACRERCQYAGGDMVD